LNLERGTHPRSLTLAQRLSVWFLTSFLGATAVGFQWGASFRKWRQIFSAWGGSRRWHAMASSLTY